MGKEKDEINDEPEEDLLNEEYKIWRKNTQQLYDIIIIYRLSWPSLTVEWLPDREEPPGMDYSVQKMILGTYAAENYPNSLRLAQVLVPLEGEDWDEDYFSSENDKPPCAIKVEFIQEINHEGEVNRARYMPQNQSIIATKAVSAEVYVFDCSKHPVKPPSDGKCNPDLRLRGHEVEGFGLSWSHFKQGHLLSGSADAQICLWDINSTPENKVLNAMRTFKVNEGVVEDVAWHMKNLNLFGSVGEDQFMHIWDLRSSSVDEPMLSVEAHELKVNCMSFNPLNEWVIATGSDDKTVRLFDTRKFTTYVHAFESHTEKVIRVGWNPKDENILASSCLGGRLMVWDLSRINGEQKQEDAKEGPPELLFTHGGHTSEVVDFSWNPCEDWTIASVAGDNILQIWKLRKHIYHDEDDLHSKDDLPCKDDPPCKDHLPSKDSLPCKDDPPCKDDLPSKEDPPCKDDPPSKDDPPCKDSNKSS